jgi:DNA-binding MarR family transcriptional regulator
MPKPRLFHLMSIAQHRLTKATDAAFKPLGVSGAQLGVLFLLEKKPGAMLKDVSDGLGINASAITALIGRMEDAGLVRRRPSDHDGRAVHIFATADGLARIAAVSPFLPGSTRGSPPISASARSPRSRASSTPSSSDSRRRRAVARRRAPAHRQA